MPRKIPEISNPIVVDRVGLADAIVVDSAGLAALGIKFSNTWLLELEDRGEFPRRISLGGRRVVWLRKEIEEFIAKRSTDEQRAASAAERRRVVRSGQDITHRTKAAA